jgi:hypothetical protein
MKLGIVSDAFSDWRRRWSHRMVAQTVGVALISPDFQNPNSEQPRPVTNFGAWRV